MLPYPEIALKLFEKRKEQGIQSSKTPSSEKELQKIIEMFNNVISSIIIENRKSANSVKALGLWHDFLREDRVMQRFRPNKEIKSKLNLKLFLGIPEGVAFSSALKSVYGIVSEEEEEGNKLNQTALSL